MEEQTNGNDICYQNPTIYCKDLYFGMRGVVGSWFLSPQRIIIETIVVVSISYLLISLVKPSMNRNNHNNGSSSSPSSALRKISRPPKVMRIATTIIFTLQIIYKICGYPGKILIMVMPCNVLWTLNMILCYYKINHQNNNNNNNNNNVNIITLKEVNQLDYSNVAYTILQLQCSYIVLVLVALANPDFSDTVLFGEVYFFIIHHFFLLYYIIHYIFITGQISTLLGGNDDYENNDKGKSTMCHVTSCITHFMQWIIMSCSYFAIFYFGIVTPLSIKSGLNLNYMLHPPPNQDDLVGEGYRITSIVYCAVSFTVMRFMIVVLEFMWRKLLQVILGRQSLINGKNDDEYGNPVKKNV